MENGKRSYEEQRMDELRYAEEYRRRIRRKREEAALESTPREAEREAVEPDFSAAEEARREAEMRRRRTEDIIGRADRVHSEDGWSQITRGARRTSAAASELGGDLADGSADNGAHAAHEGMSVGADAHRAADEMGGERVGSDNGAAAGAIPHDVYGNGTYSQQFMRRGGELSADELFGATGSASHAEAGACDPTKARADAEGARGPASHRITIENPTTVHTLHMDAVEIPDVEVRITDNRGNSGANRDRGYVFDGGAATSVGGAVYSRSTSSRGATDAETETFVYRDGHHSRGEHAERGSGVVFDDATKRARNDDDEYYIGGVHAASGRISGDARVGEAAVSGHYGAAASHSDSSYVGEEYTAIRRHAASGDGVVYREAPPMTPPDYFADGYSYSRAPGGAKRTPEDEAMAHSARGEGDRRAPEDELFAFAPQRRSRDTEHDAIAAEDAARFERHASRGMGDTASTAFAPTGGVGESYYVSRDGYTPVKESSLPPLDPTERRRAARLDYERVLREDGRLDFDEGRGGRTKARKGAPTPHIFDFKAIRKFRERTTKTDIGFLKEKIKMKISSLDFKLDTLEYTFRDISPEAKRERAQLLRDYRSLKRDRRRILKNERRDNNRYYSFLLLDMTRERLYPKADRERIAELREKLILLLRRRDDINSRLVELYLGGKGRRRSVTAERESVKSRAMRREYKKQLKLEKRIRANGIDSTYRDMLHDMMDRSVELVGTVAETRHILKHEKPRGAAKRTLKARYKKARSEYRRTSRDIREISKRAFLKAEVKRETKKNAIIAWVLVGVAVILAIVAVWQWENILLFFTENFDPGAYVK